MAEGLDRSFKILNEEDTTKLTAGTSMAMGVVSNQPMGFSVADLNPVSQVLYNSLSSKHMSAESLTSALNGAGQNLLNNVKGKFVSQKGNMTYNELLQGLTYQDESILTRDPHLEFISFTIMDKSKNIVHSKVGGRVLLTDKRLLFLSSQFVETSSLTQFGDPKKLPGGYTMDMSCNDSTYYLPISLSLVRSVEMSGRSGVSGSISVFAQKPPCGGLCGLLGCLKNWVTQPMVYSDYNEMILTFGVLMPPWQEPSYIVLHIGSHVPVHYIRDTVSLLQRYAVNLQ